MVVVLTTVFWFYYVLSHLRHQVLLPRERWHINL